MEEAQSNTNIQIQQGQATIPENPQSIQQPPPKKKINKRLLLFITAILSYLVIFLAGFTLYGNIISKVLFSGPIGLILGKLLEGTYFFGPFIAVALFTQSLNIIVSIILAFIFYPKQKLKYFFISFVAIFILGNVLSFSGMSNVITSNIERTAQKDELVIVSEEYTSKVLKNGTKSPNLKLIIQINNNSNKILSGEISSYAKHPYISLFSCTIVPKMVDIQPEQSIEISLDCYLGGNASYEQKKELMSTLPKQLDFTLSIRTPGEAPKKTYSFETQIHNWEEF